MPLRKKSEEQHRTEMVEAGKRIHALGYVAASDGNLSVRLDRERILATPTGISKGVMSAGDLVLVSPAGKKISGERNPSSELAMHLLFYNSRPDVHAVVHAHPPAATGYAAAGIPLNKALISEVVLTLGTVPLAAYGTPGTEEVTRSMAHLVREHDAILMANHGAVTCGPDLEKAIWKMETVEHFARISLVTEILGKQSPLSECEVKKLAAARARYAAPGAAEKTLSDETLRAVVETVVREILKKTGAC
ncbi:MAG: class II aldolase/adducin family protein [bacterium]